MENTAKLKENTKGFINGFKTFISRGNAVEMAVGVVIGSAFGGIIKAITDQFINPLIAGLCGRADFNNLLSFKIGEALVQPGAIITAVVQFLIVAFAIYVLVVLPMNAFSKRLQARKAQANQDAQEQAKPDPQVQLLHDILDELKKQNSHS